MPNLKEPLAGVHGTFTVERDVVKLKDVRASAGPEGHVSAKGRLPLTPSAAHRVRALPLPVMMNAATSQARVTVLCRIFKLSATAPCVRNVVLSGCCHASMGTDPSI